MKYLDNDQLTVTDDDEVVEYEGKDVVYAKSIMDKLDAQYGRKDITETNTFQSKLMNLKMESGTLSIEHFLKFKNILSDLKVAGDKSPMELQIPHLSRLVPKDYEIVI